MRVKNCVQFVLRHHSHYRLAQIVSPEQTILVFRIVQPVDDLLVGFKFLPERTMKFAACDELPQVFDRSPRPQSRQVIVESDLTFVMGNLNVSSEVLEVWDLDADHRGTGSSHRLDRAFSHGIDLLMHGFGAKEIHEDTDSGAL